ncbi:MAG: AMP-binding protein [Candidatus Riflebacteria bacterium]|nr:AMP-binding protein [Candidatus Riflebacteria bacterium]
MDFSSLLEAVKHHARAVPDRLALVFVFPDNKKISLTYSNLQSEILSFSLFYRQLGLVAGDVLVISLDHGSFSVSSFLGALYAGIVPVVFPYVSTYISSGVYLKRLPSVAKSIAIKAVLTEQKHINRVEQILSGLPCKVITPPSPLPCAVGFSGYSVCLENAAYIQFSSGTTFSPKAVEISHKALISNIVSTAGAIGFSNEIVNVGWLPLYHDLGLFSQLLFPLAMGGCSVVMEPRHWLRRPAMYFRLINEYSGNISWMPNFGFRHSVRMIPQSELSEFDLSSLKFLGNASEMVDNETILQFREHFSAANLALNAIRIGYGMAENTTVISVTQKESVISTGTGKYENSSEQRTPVVVSCGKPISDTKVEIRDDTGSSLSEGTVGEIFVSSGSIFSGYRNQAELTSKVLRKGWFKTGDLGFLKSGELFLCGRRDDLIIFGGEKIHPEAIEEACLNSSGSLLKRVVAFGIRNQSSGTESCIVLLEKSTSSSIKDENGFIQNLRAEIQKCCAIDPSDVRFVEKGYITLTTSGKLMRSEIRNRYLSTIFEAERNDDFSRTDLNNKTLEEIEIFLKKFLLPAFQKADISKDDNIFLSGVDSLALLDRICNLEKKTGHKLDLAAWMILPTISSLARIICDERIIREDKINQTKNSAPPRRKSFFQRVLNLPKWLSSFLFLRFDDYGPCVGETFLSYDLGTRLQKLLFLIPGFSNLLYRNELALLEKWIELSGYSCDLKRLSMTSLMTNTWRKWREIALRDENTVQRILTVKNEDYLQSAFRSERPVVLAAPHINPWYIVKRLPQLKGKRFTLVFKGYGPTFMENVTSRFLLLREAEDTLRNKGVVLIIADAFEGNQQGIPVPFPGGSRIFLPGPADFAVRTNALLIPVFSTMDYSGNFTVEFCPPLNSGESYITFSETEKDDKIKELTKKMGLVFASRWMPELGMRTWFYVQKNLQYLKPLPSE